MVENREPNPQEPGIDDSVLPKSSPKLDADQIITRTNSPESRVEYEPPKETPFEKQPITGQVTGQMIGSDSTDSSTGKQGDVGQTGDQTTVSSSASSLTSMSDEEFQKAKEEQKQKDEQRLQELKGTLHQIQKGEQQPQGSDSGTDQEYDYYQGQGQ